MTVMTAQSLTTFIVVLLGIAYGAAEAYVRRGRARDILRHPPRRLDPVSRQLLRYPSASGPCR
jgi:hypothetical protein